MFMVNVGKHIDVMAVMGYLPEISGKKLEKKVSRFMLFPDSVVNF